MTKMHFTKRAKRQFCNHPDKADYVTLTPDRNGSFLHKFFGIVVSKCPDTRP